MNNGIQNQTINLRKHLSRSKKEVSPLFCCEVFLMLKFMLTKLKSEESEENSGNEDTKYEEG